MNADEIVEKLKTIGIFDARQIMTFTGSRHGEPVLIHIIDAGPTETFSRYSAIIEANGRSSTGESAASIEAALSRVSWE